MSKRSTAFSFDVTVTADRSEQTGQRQIEFGRLKALTVRPFSNVTAVGQCYIEASIRQGGEEDEHAMFTPIKSYTYEGYPASWQGDFPILQQSIIHLKIWSAQATRFRVTGTIEREDD